MFTSEDELRLIRYLLDDVPQTDRDDIEERYLLDDEWFEQIQALETQLIRDYLKGDLGPEQRRQFESKYLEVPDLKRKVDLTFEMTSAANSAVGPSGQAELPPERVLFQGLSQGLSQGVSQEGPQVQEWALGFTTSGAQPTPPAPLAILKPSPMETTATPWWDRWIPRLTIAAAAFAALLFAFGLWFRAPQPKDNQQAQQPAPQPISPPDKGPEPTRPERQRVAQEPPYRGSVPVKPEPQSASPRPQLLALLLTPGMRSTRGGETGAAKLVAPPPDSFVRIDIDARQLRGRPGDSYIVLVRPVDDERPVVRQTVSLNAEGLLAVEMPGRLLPVDDYIATVRSRTGEELISYAWKVIPSSSPSQNQIPSEFQPGRGALSQDRPAPEQFRPRVEAEPPALILALSGTRATLDGKLVTSGGRLPIEPGDHRLEFFQGQGRGVVEFNIAPGVVPTVKSAAAQGMFLTAVAILGKSAKLFGARMGGLGTQDLVDVPPTGLDLTGLTEQPQPMRVSDGAEIRTYDLIGAAAPTMAIFVADPGRVDLTVLSNEEGAIVQINGRPSGVVQKGQRLEQLPPGIYKVRVSKPGFIGLPERTVTLAKGRGAREQFELKAAMASVRIVGSNTRAQVSIDGKALGEIKAGEPFVANVGIGRHRVSVQAEHHQTTDREVEFKVGGETALAWRELAVAVGYVQLSVSGANLGVSYSSAGTPPKAAAPGTLTLPVGDYTFRAIAPGGAAEQTQSTSIKMGQTVPITFVPPPRPGQTAEPAKQPGGTRAGPTAPSLFSNEWRDDDGWKKLDGGKQATIPGSFGTISFQVRRKVDVRSAASARPGWLYIMPSGFVRFELGNDKLMWWVRDKKAGELTVPKEVEDVRIEIAAGSITHSIGPVSDRIPAAELGFSSFAGGQFRFKGPISIKRMSPVLR